MSSFNDDVEVPRYIVPSSAEVNDILNDITSIISKVIGNNTITTTTTSDENDIIMLNNIQKSFDNILNSLKESATINDNDKTSLYTEINLLYSDIKLSKDNLNIMNNNNNNNKLNINTHNTALYSSLCEPYCVITNTGSISNDVNNFLKGLGKAAKVNYINVDNLAVMQDNELNYAVRGAKSIIITNDIKNNNNNNNWFGNNNDNNDDIIDLPEKSLKRLLNAVMSERTKASAPYSTKVIALTKATKQAKSIGSLLTGDSTDFDSELILKCTQRGIGYTIIKVGNIIDDDKEIPANVKRRSLSSQMRPLTKKEEERVVSQVPLSSIVFTRSRIEASECTRKTAIKEALLRAAVYPNNNSTISVVSDQAGTISNEEWDDEFSKLDGPELHRIPLRFASVMQTTLKLGRIALDLQQPKSGLITPINVERFSNGVRILFKPKESGYLSSKEEKLREMEANEAKKVKARKSGYISPEEESKQAAAAVVEEKSPKKKVEQLEGGLEVVVDTTPYRRVRIRRCNIGPQTILKEESEATLLKALLQGIDVLENDYRILLTKEVASLVSLK